MKYVTMLMLLLINLSIVYSQTSFDINIGSTPIIDGTVSDGEWDDAGTVQIQATDTKIIEIYYKMDSEAFYFMFSGMSQLTSMEMLFPEVCFDINNSKSAAWEEDDWWFHVSATDCESKGEPDNYETCREVKEEWQAVPNYGNQIPEAIEIKIPFEYIGLVIENTENIGILFMMNNFAGPNKTWPDDIVYSSPVNWATANLNSTINVTTEEEKSDLIITPNPADDILHIKGLENSITEFILTDVHGKLLLHKHNHDINAGIDISSIAKGMYFIKFYDGNRIRVLKFIKN